MSQNHMNKHYTSVRSANSYSFRHMARPAQTAQTRKPVVNANTILEGIRKDVTARPDSLRAARDRRDRVLEAVRNYPGVLRTYPAGSLATRFTNDPVSDADSGVVMDRRKLPELGPDGQGELPGDLVDFIGVHIRPLLARRYRSIRVERMKRGLLIRFNIPLSSGEDPSVDLVVALNRVEDDALWIPNLDKNSWDPSHPEKHVELFTSGSDKLRQTRRHVVRVAKAQVQQFSEPHICSFNIAALAWECIEHHERLDLALHRFYRYAAIELSKHLTQDPAGVSAPVKVDDRQSAIKRLRCTADGLQRAIYAGDDEHRARAALAAEGVFWKLLSSKKQRHDNRVITTVRDNAPVSVTPGGMLTANASSLHSVRVKSTRAYGSIGAVTHSDGRESRTSRMTPARRSGGHFG